MPSALRDDTSSPAIRATTRTQAMAAGGLMENRAWLRGWEVDNMRLSQLNDPVIGPLLTRKEDGPDQPPWKDISHLSDSFKSLWAQWERLKMHGGLLFRRSYPDRTGRTRLQLLVPEDKWHEVFQHLHEHSTGGHMGVQKTKNKIAFAFFWPGLQQTVEKLCRRCDSCAARKPSLKRPRAPLQQYLVGNPMERIAVDILGPLPKTRRGNSFVLVLRDYFTKWMEAFAIPNQEAQTVARVVVEQFICNMTIEHLGEDSMIQEP